MLIPFDSTPAGDIRFKMHVRSHRATTLDMAERLPPLPSGKTVIDVLGDFMKYLLQCAKSYIEDAHANGREVWTSIESSINYIVSHPNGWEGFQQAQMLDAAIQAGLIADSERGRSKVTFVTEGEASLHYAIHHGLPDGVLNVCRLSLSMCEFDLIWVSGLSRSDHR